jgi:hypothetical protein
MNEFQNPYASPTQFEPQPKSHAPLKPVYAPPYQSAGTIALVTMVLLALNGLIDAASAGSSALQLELLQRAVDGVPISEEEAAANDNREMLVGVTQLGLYLVTAVVFLIWFFRAHRNLGALGAQHLQYSPAWAVGGWFVPFLNLVRPCQVAQEIWRFSDPSGIRSPVYAAHGSALVGWWWAMWIIGGILGQISFRLNLNADSPQDYLVATWVALGSCVVGLPLAALAIGVVYQINKNQEERHNLIQSSSPAAPFLGATSF